MPSLSRPAPVRSPSSGQAAVATAFPWEQDLRAASTEQETWLVSFIDVLTLLLTLFVLLLAYQHQTAEQAGGAMAAVPTVPASTAPLHTGVVPVERVVESIPTTVAQGEAPAAVPPESPPDPILNERTGPTPAAPRAAATVAPADENRDAGIETVTGSDELPALDPVAARPDFAATAVLLFWPTPEANPVGELLGTWSALTTVGVSTSLPTEVPGGAAAVEPAAVTAQTAAETAASAVDRLLAQVEASDLRDRIEATVIQNGVNLEISDSILFAPARAELTPVGRALLDELTTVMNSYAFSVSVEGHTDNIPIETPWFPSNWELASARASVVTRYLVTRGIPAERLRAIGYADTRPRADNATPEGRARNRRVSFVLQAVAAPVEQLVQSAAQR